MKKLLVVFVVCTVSFATYALNPNVKVKEKSPEGAIVLSGVVTDSESGEALTGVRIDITGIETATYTDFDGKYRIELQQNGTYTINFKLITYKSQVMTEHRQNNNVKMDVSLSRL